MSTGEQAPQGQAQPQSQQDQATPQGQQAQPPQAQAAPTGLASVDPGRLQAAIDNHLRANPQVCQQLQQAAAALEPGKMGGPVDLVAKYGPVLFNIVQAIIRELSAAGIG